MNGDQQFWDQLAEFFDDGAQYLETLFPDRPHEGQDHTDQGERGKTEVRGISLRDLADCYVIGTFEASGIHGAENYPRTIYELPWHDMDPMAIQKGMLCRVEERMGIYPNLPYPKVWRADGQKTTGEDDAKRYRGALESVLRLVGQLGRHPTLDAAVKAEIEKRIWEVL